MIVIYTVYRLICKVQKMNIDYKWYRPKVQQFIFIMQSKLIKKEILKPETRIWNKLFIVFI